MRIYLHSIMAGPAGVRHPGYHHVTDEEADTLIESGYAVPGDEHEAGAAEAAVSPPKEMAMLPRPKPTGSRKPKVTPPNAPPAPPTDEIVK